MSNEVEMVPVVIAEQWDLILPKHRADRGDEWKTWERAHLESMHEHLGPGDVVYDIGAEEGDFPGLFASWGCEVALFEPNPLVWPNMRAIWKANDLPHPLGCFVGFAGSTDYAPEMPLPGTGWHIDYWPPCAYGPVIGNHGFLNLCERPDVPAITLNTASTIIKPPTAITVDVEGAEFQVFSGAWQVIDAYRPKVWVSVHPQFMADMYDDTPEMLHDWFRTHGYTAELLADVHEQHWLYLPEEN